jgi:hypothetical protein
MSSYARLRKKIAAIIGAAEIASEEVVVHKVR